MRRVPLPSWPSLPSSPLPQALLRPRRPLQGHWLTSSDGVRLWARHDPRLPGAGSTPGADLALVLVHGFTLSAASPPARAVVGVLTRRCAVVSLDLRGHGRSGGQSTVGDAEALDVDAAVGWARTLGYRRVVTLGFSLGAASVLRHAGCLHATGPDRRTRHPVDAVVAVSGPSRWNYRGTAAMRRLHLALGTPPGRLLLRGVLGTRVAARGWDPWPEPPDVMAARVRVPLLVVHGEQDALLPVEHARWLHAAASRDGAATELWLEPGTGHAEVAVGADLADRVARWSLAAAGRGGLPGCRGAGAGVAGARW